MLRHYCTAFDCNFLPQGLALWHSLRAAQSDAVLWVLALDEATAEYLCAQAQANLRTVELSRVEADFTALAEARANRSRIEYIFTLTPFWPAWLLDNERGIDVLVQVDADMAFFSNPTAMLAELSSGSVLLTEHGFPSDLRWMEARGRFNVGVQAYRNDALAREALEWWQRCCVQWCYDRVEPGRYADQGYLDELARRFPGVVVCRHPGINLAPWNWMTRTYSFRGDQLLVDGQPLVVFHFARFHPLGGRRYASGQIEYGVMGFRLRSWIYERYARWLDKVAADDGRLSIRPVARDRQVAWRQALLHGMFGTTWWRLGGWWVSGRLGLGRYSARVLGWWRGRGGRVS